MVEHIVVSFQHKVLISVVSFEKEAAFMVEERKDEFGDPNMCKFPLHFKELWAIQDYVLILTILHSHSKE